MDFKTFKKLAIFPAPKMFNTIYVIQAYTIPFLANGNPGAYPFFHLYPQTLGFFDFLETAESALLEVIPTLNYIPYCFYINEFPKDCCFDVTDLSDEAFTRRLYGADGRLLEKSVCCSVLHDSWKDYGVFRGREPETIRFRVGDIVEFRDGCEVRLGVVTASVPTIKQCYETYQSNSIEDGTDSLLDNTDDQYTILDITDGQHTHVSPLNVMAPAFPVSGDLKTECNKLYNNYLEKRNN